MKKNKFSKIAWICAVVLIFQCFVPVSIAQETAETQSAPVSTVEYALFEALDMLCDGMEFTSDGNMSRGDFAYIIARMAGYDGAAYSGSRFTDVNDGQYFAGAVNFLADKGVVTGYGIDFRPNEDITYDEAAAMAIRALGYGEYSQIKYGGYPANARMKATKLDLFDYTDEFAYTDSVTAHNGFIILENVSKAPALYDVAYVNDEVVYEKSEYKTLLSINYDIYCDVARLNDNGITGLKGISTVGSGKMIIGDVTYKCGDNLDFVCEYIGEMIDYWYDDDNDILIHARRNNDESHTLEIPYSSLLSDNSEFSAQNIVYYDENDKTKNASVSVAADVIYNNAAYPYYVADDFKITSGKLMLIDIDNNKVYDTVKITEYADTLIAAVSADNNQVVLSTGTIHLDEYEQYALVDIEGNNIEISHFAAKTPVSVIESKDGKTYIKIIDCTLNTVSGTLQAESTADGTEWMINDVYYAAGKVLIDNIVAGGKKAPEVGESYTLYRNADGAVFDYKKALSSDDWYDGYVLAIADETHNMQSKLKARILMTDKTTIDVHFAEKFRLNDVTVDMDDALKSTDLFNIKGTQKYTKRQPIRFKLNSWEEINSFETPKDITGESYPFDTETFSLDAYFPAAQYKAEYVKAIEEMYLVTASTLIIRDPHLTKTGEYLDGSDVEFLTVDDLAATDGLNNCYLYDFDTTLTVGTIVFDSFPGETSASFDNTLTIIDKVYRVLDEDGKDVYKVDCGRYGAYQSFELYDDTVDVSGLKRGDVINIRLREGKIAEYKYMCNLTEPGEAKYVDVPENSFINKVHSVIYAPVFSVNSAGVVLVAPKEELGGKTYQLIGNSFNGSNTRVVIYDVKAKTIKAGAISSIYANMVPDEKGNYTVDSSTTRVLLRRRWGYAAEAVFVIH